MARRRFAEGFLSRRSYPVIASLRPSAAAGREKRGGLSLLSFLFSSFFSRLFAHRSCVRATSLPRATIYRAQHRLVFSSRHASDVRRTIFPPPFGYFLTRLLRIHRFTRGPQSPMLYVRDAIALIADASVIGFLKAHPRTTAHATPR